MLSPNNPRIGIYNEAGPCHLGVRLPSGTALGPSHDCTRQRLGVERIGLVREAFEILLVQIDRSYIKHTQTHNTSTMAEIAQYEAPYNESPEQEKLNKAVQCNAEIEVSTATHL